MPVPLRVMVIGAAGRLGAALCGELQGGGHSVVALTRSEADLTHERSITDAVLRHRPHAVINCAGYNAVDAAETDMAEAFAVNAAGPAVLARAAAQAGAVLVHYGSDFVFDGATQQPYDEDDPTNPLSVYGASKLAGETEAQRAPRHYVLRVESLFGGRGVRGHRSTVDYIADTLLAGGTVRAFVDRTVSPSYVPDVAFATRKLIERNPRYGVYHCVNSGMTTWYDLAQYVAESLDVAAAIEPVEAAATSSLAKRPLYCALSNRKLTATGIVMPEWQAAVRRHVTARARQRHAEGVTT
jgi:dTDP-4-dehydrorhamnose reductase